MLLFCDSFDHYASADILNKYNVASNPGTNTQIQAGLGRRGTACLEMSAGTGVTKSGLANHATYIVGAAIYPDDFSSAGPILAFIDSGTIHITISVNTSGQILVYRGAHGATLLATSASALATDTWYYLEVKVTINDSTGTVEVRVNGSNTGWHNITGADTRNGASAQVNAIRIDGGTQDMRWDDLVIMDGSGSAPHNDFIGDVRVDAYLPNGNGNSSQLDGSDGNSVDNYLLVDDAAPDSDSTYVQSATATEKDTYAFANMSHTPATIYGVQINMTAKKDDAGTRSIAAVTRSDGADYDGTTQALSTAYTGYREVLTQDPDTSAAWTKSGFDAAEFGVKVAA